MPLTKVNGINIHYRVRGSGEPLVLIMGFMGTGQGWFFQASVFARHYQVVTFDNRGVGKSDKPEGDYTTKTMADDTAALMEHLQIDAAHIVGVSMGGMIAQELAINHPNRVRRLVLVSTMAGREGLSGYSPDLVSAITGRETYTEDELGTLDLSRATSAVISLSFNSRLCRWLLVPLAKLLRFKMDGMKGLAGQAAACNSHYTLDRLRLIEAPTLVLSGTGDRIFPDSCADVIAAGVPDARLVKFAGGSHTLIVEMRNEFNRLTLGYLSGDVRYTMERLIPDC